MPRKAPCGELPGRGFGKEVSSLYERIIDLPVKHDIKIRRSQGGTCIGYRSSNTILWDTRLNALLRSTLAIITAWHPSDPGPYEQTSEILIDND